MNRSSSFPPGAGWIPLVVGVAFALTLSAFALSPRYFDRIVVDQTNQKGAAAPVATEQTQLVGGSAGTSGTGVAGGTTNSTGIGSHAGCSAATNGGTTAPGVSATSITIASTIVTTGVGSGFLGEAQDGMKAAINEANNRGGICGRHVSFGPNDQYLVNSGWDGPTGKADIDNFINSGSVFALVGQSDSQGLDYALSSGSIDRAGIPVVGTDGLLKGQYHNQWVWPVAASTVSNVHIIAKYAYDHGARKFGIVFDNQYKFGVEGATAFDDAVFQLTGQHIPNAGSTSCSPQYCGVPADQTGNYSTYAATFNQGCGPCDAVVVLLEPTPMEAWMRAENGNQFYKPAGLYGGEPLFDDNVANNCPGCGEAAMRVWTGYHPSIQPFDSEPAVAQYRNSLLAVRPSDDPHNEFTEGAYLGTKMFLAACQKVADLGLPLTRASLQKVLNTNSWDLKLSTPLSYNGGALPHLANISMAMFAENYSGSFNGWSYQSTGFLADPWPGRDL